METVQFKVGAQMGIRLHEIAHEHLIYNLDPQKAISVFTESFGEQCPDDIKRKLLIGEMIILVDEEEQIFNVVDRANHMAVDEMYPKLNVTEWIEKKYNEIGDRGKDIYDTLQHVNRKLKYGTLVSSNTFQFNFDPQLIIDFAQGDEDSLINEIREDERVKVLSDVIRFTKMYLETVFKLKKVFKILHSWYPDKYVETSDMEITTKVMFELQCLLNSNFKKFAKEYTEENSTTDIDQYIETEIEHTKTIEKGIQPVDIMDNYSAGWLAPDGETFYGMNGETANMLHNKLAEAMYKAGVIPQGDVNENNPDEWLNDNGWVRIHGNHVTYDGYSKANYYERLKKTDPELAERLNYSKYSKEVPITKEQVETIADYIMYCHQSLVRVGLPRYKMSATMFRNIDPIQFKLKFFE